MVSRGLMVWSAISVYVVLLLFTWLDYFMKLTGYATLEGALLYTVIAPPLTYIGFRIYQTKSLKFWQSLWAIFGAAVFGFVMYAIINLLLNRVLSLPVWTQMDGLTQTVLVMPISYVIGAYIGYRIGKRRDFRPLLLQF
jgi:hypothetical protein